MGRVMMVTMDVNEPREDPVEALRRWEAFGATWEVVHRTAEQVTVSLRRCDGGEEVERLVSRDPRLREYVDRRAATSDG